MALAPLPTTATRLPRRSMSWRQLAEWNISPWKDSMPLVGGMKGLLNAPPPHTSVWPLNTRPLAVVTTQVEVPSSKRAFTTLAL